MRFFIFLLIFLLSFVQASKNVGAKKGNDRWDGEHYKNNSNTQQGIALPILNTFSFKGNEHILDIGCGDGNITAELANEVPNGSVIGFDISENMVKTALKDHSKIKNLSFKVADACDFSFDKKFD